MHIYVFIIVFSLCLPPLLPLPPHFNPPHEIHLMPEVRKHAITLLFIPDIVAVTPRYCQAGETRNISWLKANNMQANIRLEYPKNRLITFPHRMSLFTKHH